MDVVFTVIDKDCNEYKSEVICGLANWRKAGMEGIFFGWREVTRLDKSVRLINIERVDIWKAYKRSCPR